MHYLLDLSYAFPAAMLKDEGYSDFDSDFEAASAFEFFCSVFLLYSQLSVFLVIQCRKFVEGFLILFIL